MCTWWMTTTMRDVKTGEVSLKHECAVTMIAPMMVELIGKTNSVGAAVESSRNENMKRQDALLALAHTRYISGS